MIDWDAVHYDPIYSSQGRPAEITIGSADPIAVTLVNYTQAMSPETHGVTVATIKPGYCIRVSEMEEKGISRDDLEGAGLEVRSQAWRIVNTEPRPGPDGPGTGEYLLIIED